MYYMLYSVLNDISCGVLMGYNMPSERICREVVLAGRMGEAVPDDKAFEREEGGAALHVAGHSHSSLPSTTWPR